MNFFSWRRNVATFEESKSLFYVICFLLISITFFLWIYKSKIKEYFNQNKKFLFHTFDKDTLFSVIGYIVLFFNVIRIIILLLTDYPWKWELFPIHLCRFFTFYIAFVLIFKKAKLIEYIAILAILGGLAGILFANLGEVKEFIDQDRIYNSFKEGTIEWERAGLNLGYDSYLYWDFILAHTFVIVMPVFLSLAYSETIKINIRSQVQGYIYLVIIGIFTFLLAWILNSIGEKSDNPKIKIILDANWLYLGKTGINTLGSLSQWPFAIISFSIIVPILWSLSYFVYLLLSCIEFEISEKLLIKKIRFLNLKKQFKNSQENYIFKKKKRD
ncbi:TMEM164 family acyltransferase [Mesomycoplasma molare]|uniref:YwaF family protein n=1 Tax=Mesomycoplasma molare TaxID=171288 RepID=A0ABY5TUF2_9BACT|nr:YwaF family protein [Mesomycoplasma molare]UWD34215.1 YwaF family protein [Mesomycoplasma molare]